MGLGDRSGLPTLSDSRYNDVDARNDPRVFFSAAYDYFPRVGSEALPSWNERYWQQKPGEVNLKMVEASPDGYALQRAFRAALNLATIAALVERDHLQACTLLLSSFQVQFAGKERVSYLQSYQSTQMWPIVHQRGAV